MIGLACWGTPEAAIFAYGLCSRALAVFVGSWSFVRELGRRDKAIDIGCIGRVVMGTYGGVESVLSGIYELCGQIYERGQSGDSRVNSSSSGDCLYSAIQNLGRVLVDFRRNRFEVVVEHVELKTQAIAQAVVAGGASIGGGGRPKGGGCWRRGRHHPRQKSTHWGEEKPIGPEFILLRISYVRIVDLLQCNQRPL